MNWVTHEDDINLPAWLRDSLPSKCSYCGSELLNGYNEAGECTRRVCSNKSCRGTVGARIGQMCDMLGISGVKSGIGTRLATDHRLANHFQAVPLLVSEKPKISLAKLFKIAFIYGLDSEFDRICTPYSSVTEFFNDYRGLYYNMLLGYKDLLLEGEKYFDIQGIDMSWKKYDSVVSGCIVIHGEIPGFDNRDTFVGSVNRTYCGLTAFSYSKSARKTGLYCCISQDKFATSKKTSEALANGFPVYTVSEFYQSVNQKICDLGHRDELMELINAN